VSKRKASFIQTIREIEKEENVKKKERSIE
jgi:hypothetical protein